MHDRLYDHPEALSDEELVSHAAALGLDTDRFAADLAESEHESRVRENFESGIESGLDSAPTFFIDGERYDGRYTADAITNALVESGDLANVPLTATPRGGGSDALRETIDRSERGAPAAGSAVRDRFSADEISQRVVTTANEEFSRSNRLLFLSGPAAGIVMNFSFLGSAALTALVSDGGGPPSDMATAIGYLLYPLGFVGVVLGSYQLFTENTLTPVTLVMTRIASVPALVRVWGIVLAANVLGAAASAYVLARTGVFEPETAAVAHEFGAHFLELSWGTLFWKGVFAGALVGRMVWLVHAARDTAARVLVIFLLTYTVAAAGLAHSIVGAAEMLYVVFGGDAILLDFLGSFLPRRCSATPLAASCSSRCSTTARPAIGTSPTGTVASSNSSGPSGYCATTSAEESPPCSIPAATRPPTPRTPTDRSAERSVVRSFVARCSLGRPVPFADRNRQDSVRFDTMRYGAGVTPVAHRRTRRRAQHRSHTAGPRAGDGPPGGRGGSSVRPESPGGRFARSPW
jgi:formate/nitrite transporter FocA (FNT family)